MINSYSEVMALGHRYLDNLFDGEVDGSAFSMQVVDGKLYCRSKGKQIGDENGVDKMFDKAIATAEKLKDKLRNNWIYRCEYLSKPKHNTICYSRTPIDNLIVYDIDTGNQCYLCPVDKKTECQRIGLECVPWLTSGTGFGLDEFKVLLDIDSVLGGSKIEGVVIKNYDRFGKDKKALMGKYVSEEFKEKHGVEWKSNNKTSVDTITLLGQELRTDARWDKAVQHLKEQGLLANEPKDIGLLVKEVPADIEKEEIDYIKDKLYQWAWPQIKRIVVAGLPEYYKEKLANSQFKE